MLKVLDNYYLKNYIINSENITFSIELRFQIEHMEIVEWHSVSISSEDKEIITDHNTGMSISSWWSLALVLSKI